MNLLELFFGERELLGHFLFGNDRRADDLKPDLLEPGHLLPGQDVLDSLLVFFPLGLHHGLDLLHHRGVEPPAGSSLPTRTTLSTRATTTGTTLSNGAEYNELSARTTAGLGIAAAGPPVLGTAGAASATTAPVDPGSSAAIGTAAGSALTTTVVIPTRSAVVIAVAEHVSERVLPFRIRRVRDLFQFGFLVVGQLQFILQGRRAQEQADHTAATARTTAEAKPRATTARTIGLSRLSVRNLGLQLPQAELGVVEEAAGPTGSAGPGLPGTTWPVLSSRGTAPWSCLGPSVSLGVRKRAEARKQHDSRGEHRPAASHRAFSSEGWRL
jgi:hypothetical protein